MFILQHARVRHSFMVCGEASARGALCRLRGTCFSTMREPGNPLSLRAGDAAAPLRGFPTSACVPDGFGSDMADLPPSLSNKTCRIYRG